MSSTNATSLLSVAGTSMAHLVPAQILPNVTHECVADYATFKYLTFTNSEAMTAINNGCEDWFGHPGVLGGDFAYKSAKTDKKTINMNIDICREGVKAPEDAVDLNMCKTGLKLALNSCDTKSTSKKYGNNMKITGPDGYCMIWRIYTGEENMWGEPSLTALSVVVTPTPSN